MRGVSQVEDCAILNVLIRVPFLTLMTIKPSGVKGKKTSEMEEKETLP